MASLVTSKDMAIVLERTSLVILRGTSTTIHSDMTISE